VASSCWMVLIADSGRLKGGNGAGGAVPVMAADCSALEGFAQGVEGGRKAVDHSAGDRLALVQVGDGPS
jgi:hypothetical protein